HKAYYEALLESGRKYLASADTDTINIIDANLRTLDHLGLRGVAKRDMEQYLTGGLYEEEKGLPPERTGQELTNPLLLRLHDLGQSGLLDRDEAKGAVFAAHTMSLGKVTNFYVDMEKITDSLLAERKAGQRADLDQRPS
ncbi:MAG TPA: hypothetical protein VIN59_05850, partial [Alphaproteobacteria bacterium]